MKHYGKIWLIVWLFMGITMTWGAATLLLFSGNYFSKEKYTTRDVITHYQELEPTVTVETNIVEVPLQRNLDIPGFDFSSPDTLILFDISGSMQEQVTSFYKENLAFFQEGHDVWFFNTNIQRGVSIDDIEFGGDTNVVMAVNTASLAGYKNILIFSDMEQTIAKTSLNVPDESNLAVYILSPRKVTNSSVIDELKDCTGVQSVKLLEIN